MLSTRKTILTLVAITAISCLAPAAPANAGPLCNCLFGRRNTSYYVPTATYVPTAAGATVTAGYLPSASVAAPTATVYYPRMTSYYPPNPYYRPTTSYRATLPPQGMPVAAYAAPVATQALPVAPQASYYAARPAVSQYAVAPTTTAYSPIVGGATAVPSAAGATPYYLPPRPQQSFFGSWWSRPGTNFGSGNYYPSATPYPHNAYTASYWSSLRMPSAPATTSNYPPQPIPVAGGTSFAPQPHTMNQPIVTTPSHAAGFAPQTAYSTKTYNAPVTYYRPVPGIDPTTGQPTTTMQGCRSYQTQVKRIPSYSLGGAMSTGGQTQPSCPPGTYDCSPAYGTNQYAPVTNQPNYQVAPTGGPGSQRPSFGGASPQSNPTPQYPSAIGSGTPTIQPPAVGADRSPIGQPQLSPTTSAKPTASQRTTEPRQRNYLDVKPIPAPSEYRFQFNTTDDRTATKPSQISTVGYKKIEWSVERETKRSTAARRIEQSSSYSQSGWTSSAR